MSLNHACSNSISATFGAFLSLFFLALTGVAAHATAPVAPSNLEVYLSLVTVPPVAPSTTPTYRHEYVWKWADNATDEDGFVIDIHIGSGTSFSSLYTISSGITSETIPFASSLTTDSLAVGSKVYFQVRAFKGFTGTQYSSPSNAVFVTIPATTALAFAAPTGLATTAVGENGRLTWTDTCDSEAVWQIEYRDPPSTTWIGYRMQYQGLTSLDITPLSNFTNAYANFIYGQLGGNITLYNGYRDARLVPGHTYEFRVRARKTSAPSTDLANYADSNPVSFTMPSMVAPTNLVATAPTETSMLLTWVDNSSIEMGYAYEYHSPGDVTNTWTLFNFANPNTTSATVSVGVNVALDWRVRAVFQDSAGNNTFSFQTNEANIATALAVPTGVGITNPSATSVNVTWTDNSSVETSYELLGKHSGEALYTILASVPANTTTATYNNLVTTVAMEFAVRAVKFTAASGNVAAFTEYSAISAIVTRAGTTGVAFNPPTNLAFTNITANSVSFSWTDNSFIETGYELLGKLSGDASYSLLATTAVNATTATYNNLIANVGVEFALRAVQLTPASGSVAASSIYSATTAPITREGFIGTIRGYEPITKGVAFSYQFNTSNTSNRTAFTAPNLPAGVTFNTATGLISGTPTVTGVFVCPITATWANGQTASSSITLRVIPPSGSAPVVAATLPARALALTTVPIAISGKFTDPDTEQAVRIATTLGNIDVALYPSLTPLTVANFLAYANAGDYNAVAFHRALAGFVLQGGGFKPTTAPNNYVEVTKRTPQPLNEPGISNVTGTIAMAKQGGDPNSASHDFFFSLANNNSSDANSLDNQNGGFTVFGHVVGSGMSTVNAIVAKPQLASNGTYAINAGTASGPYANWPMNVTDVGSLPTTMDNTLNLLINTITALPTLSYTATSSNEAVATVAIDGNGVPQLTGLSDGTSTITITATDLDGQTVSQNFLATVDAAYIAPSITTHPTNVNVAYLAEASFSVVAAGSNVTYQWRKGSTNIPNATSATYTIANVVPADAGSYTVVVSDAVESITSNPATLTVQYVTASITTPPSNTTVTVGAPASFTVVAAGDAPLTYQWKKGTTVIPTATAATYTIDPTIATDAGSYTVTVTNLTGNVTSAPVTLALHFPPSVTTHPASITRGVNASAAFTVLAAGDATLTYQWKKGTTEIPLATAATYTIPSVSPGDAGDYSVVVTNAYGMDTSNPATLTVTTGPPSITTHPASITRGVNAEASFTVFATGDATLTYQWKKGTTEIPLATAATYTIPITSTTDAGQYSVVVTNASGVAPSNPATLTVTPLAPLSLTALEVKRIPAGTFTSKAIIGPPVTLPAYWLGTKELTNAQFAAVLQHAFTTLGLITVEPATGGRRQVMYATHPVCLLATHVASEPGGLVENEVDFETSTQTFFVPASVAHYPVRNVTWYGAYLASVVYNSVIGYPGKNIPASFGYVADANGYSIPTDSQWEWAARGGSAALAFPVGATVKPTLANYVASLIGTTKPVGSYAPSKLGLYDLAGNVAEWVIPASSSYIRGGSWASDSTELLNNKFVLVAKDSLIEKTGIRLALRDDRIPAIADVDKPQPQLVTAGTGAGHTITFSVTATGAPPLTYQWLKKGVAIAGKTTTTLSIPNAQLTDGAEYSVKVSNALKTITSPTTSATVVDTTSATVYVPLSTSTRTKLKTLVGGPTTDLQYNWKVGANTPMTFFSIGDTFVANGATTPTFSIFNVQCYLDVTSTGLVTLNYPGSSYFQDFQCAISKTGVATPVNSGITHFQVVIQPIIPAFSFPSTGRIGTAFGDFTIPLHSLYFRYPQSYTITGLPKGMAYDKITGRIYGTPTTAGSFLISVFGHSLYGVSDKVTSILNIGPLPGKYVAPLSRSTVLNDDFGGLLTLDTTSTNTYTGKVVLGTKTYPIKGNLIAPTTGNLYTGRAVIPLTAPNALQLDFTIDATAPNTDLLAGTLGTVTLPATTPGNTIAINGWRNRFATLTPNTAQVGLHNLSLDLDTADKHTTGITNLDKPQGMSFASITVTANGTTTFAGRLADDTAFTTTSVLGPTGQVPVWQMLYGNKGSIVGGCSITANAAHTVGALASSPITWQKKAQPLTVRTYQSGFGPLTLTPSGGKYIVPAATPAPSHKLVMGLADSPVVANNAKLSLTQAGVTTSTTWASTPGIADTLFSVSLANLATFTPATNPGKASLKFTAATGDFTGTFTLAEPTPAGSKATFKGKIISTSNHGHGYFILPALAPAAILSGRVELMANP